MYVLLRTDAPLGFLLDKLLALLEPKIQLSSLRAALPQSDCFKTFLLESLVRTPDPIGRESFLLDIFVQCFRASETGRQRGVLRFSKLLKIVGHSKAFERRRFHLSTWHTMRSTWRAYAITMK